ncbi:fibrinogen C domain-containing protein 1-like [Drosophila sulfurigaster albostrigata]|uniref:fibrinogen C domain-containing protein 1-like n=1 Tax=Drosophila sulfurigaster albostrigata TaxID=89887 RepID=UPI002D21DF23|nr:fibrinogen C domain-containing protein 1-like [Drosophila sulfurigaster albostrigata]XP_062134566.1 fibrinogen C domain-containing protein 1-like [Drosophila sulfurigaster albostrigata]
MKIVATVLLIIFNLGIIHSNHEYDLTTESNEVKNTTFAIITDNEEKCYGYCFNIIQPVLEHTVHIQVKDQQILKLAKQIEDLKMKVAIFEETIKNKDEQILVSDKYKNETLELFSQSKEKVIEYKTKLENCLAPNCIGKVTDIYEIKVPGIDAFSVPCDSRLAGAGWTVIQRRMDGSVDFNRNWTDYRQGFGDLRGEFFIGLDKLHLITKSQTHELYIYLNNGEAYARYDNFYIGDEEEFYKIKSIGRYSGNVGDALSNHFGSKFSTSDRDNDVSSNHCGQQYKSGWWFTNCYTSNLNGLYNGTNTFVWRTWYQKNLKNVQMMIRPK